MEILGRINWVDIFSIILLLRITYASFRGGLSHELFSTLGVFFNLIVSIHYYQKIGNFVSETVSGFPVALSNFFSFLLLSAALALLFRLIRMILDRVIKIEWHPFIEGFGGLVAGAVKAFMSVSLVLMLLILLPLPYMQWSVRDKSVTGMFFLSIGPTIYSKTYRQIPGIKAQGEPMDMNEFMRALTEDKAIGPVNDMAKPSQKVPSKK